jgi:DNA-binding LacI/PurR family transcriptional regulator
VATTLRNVAQLAQVSVKTVSNVVNDHPNVSDDVRRRVEQAIRQLDYRPDLAARALRTGRSGLIALAVPGVDEPCPPGLVDQVIGHATRFGFQVVIEPISNPWRRATSGTRSAAQPRVDAVLLMAEKVTPELVDPHARTGVPLVVIAAELDPGYDCVAFDATGAARDATNHLLRTGRRRIAAIGAHPDELGGPPRARTMGYLRAVDRAGISVPAGYLYPTTGQRHADGYHAARTLFTHPQRPDAIFCYDDRLASGVIRAAADAGLRVPEDLAVIGIGDSDEGRYSRPTLSTVATRPAYIARHALELLTRRLKDTAAAIGQIVAPHGVVARESTAPVSDLPGG